jgi:hypothetical protein
MVCSTFAVAIQPYEKCNLTKIRIDGTIYSISAGTPPQSSARFGLFSGLLRDQAAANGPGIRDHAAGRSAHGPS